MFKEVAWGVTYVTAHAYAVSMIFFRFQRISCYDHEKTFENYFLMC